MRKMKVQMAGVVGFFLRSVTINLTFLMVLSSPSYAQDPSPAYKKKGKASFYAHKFQGCRTTNGERYDKQKMTAAHRTLPFGTLVKVTNSQNGNFVIVRINDRGPFAHNRLIDVSYKAAQELGIVGAGVASVEVEVVGQDAVPVTQNDEMLVKTIPPIAPRKPTSQSTAAASRPIAFPEPVPVSASKTYQAGKIYTLQGAPVAMKGFGVQVGAFQELDHALTVCKNLVNNQATQVYILVEKVKDSKSFCVLTGKFRNRTEAQTYVASLREKGYTDGFVKKYIN